MDDRSIVEIQIDRSVRSRVDVRTRCHLGLPVVIDVPPLLEDGTPFPTMFWLTCPLARLRVSRIESSGGVRAADALIESNALVAEQHAAAMQRYESERSALIPDDWDGPKPSGGVAGSSGGVKCLHAHYADTAAGNDNPVGEDVAERIEPLACTAPCVIANETGMERNPAWVEPR